MLPAVHLRGAVALIGRFPALAGADLDVAPGDIVALRGPNGAGKTSLLRACAGLLPVVDGATDRSAAARKSPLVTGVPPASGALFLSTSRYERALLPEISAVDCAPVPSQPAGDSAVPTVPGPSTTACGVFSGSSVNTL